MKVTWPASSSAENVSSNPLCYRYEKLITRNCNGTHWEPSLRKLEPCLQISNYFDLLKCPPGHQSVSAESDYCYQINSPSAWNYPCYKSGSASVITDLTDSDIFSLLNSLNATNNIKYFWLPAQRVKLYNPVVWHIPGPNWGRVIETRNDEILQMRTSLSKNCLQLDVQQRTIRTEQCNKSFPSLCLYINDLRYPESCPDGYHGFRFMPDDGICYGIEQSDGVDLTYEEFVEKKCPKPMGGNELERFIFSKIAGMSFLNDSWCWFRIETSVVTTPLSVQLSDDDNGSVFSEVMVQSFQGIINSSGTLSLRKTSTLLPCMACEVEMTFTETEFILDYDESENKLHLTVYYPIGLWKYDVNDTGVQCFSNAKGFVKVVDVNEEPFFKVRISRQASEVNSSNADKIVYEIDPVTHRAAQYWCEGHTKNFSLVTTEKLIVSPNSNEEHVFAIVIKKCHYTIDDDEPDMSDLIANVTEIFHANTVLVMDILDFSIGQMIILMHLHVPIRDNFDDKARNVEDTFFSLKEIAEIEFPKYNYTLVNISSSIYCLPTTSNDALALNWEMTPIGHIAAPQQFCLQANGLPVKRHCHGSYLLGSSWGDVEGTCDTNYEPSSTTKFLFDFVKGNMPDNDSTSFLTDGLEFVLSDVGAIIPADIYYLSMSLQHVLYLAETNQSVDMGDIQNIAWVMDRVMSLDQSYLWLSQTLNSTNVILDSVNDIIEHLVEEHTKTQQWRYSSYLLAVEPQFVVQISYPKHNNITGIVLINNTDFDNFTSMKIQPLFANTTLSDVLSIENLEAATWLPNQIIDSLERTSNVSTDDDKLHIVISVFYNDAVFPELEETRHKINSRVIGISIPGYSSNLKHSIPLVFRNLDINGGEDQFCGYWNFQAEDTKNVPGSWKKKGCFSINSTSSFTVCECYHLTHFGQLLNTFGNSGNDNDNISTNHKRALNFITLIGSFISIIGIIGIWITASVFSSWRKKAGTKVLLHLSTAIALPLVFIIVFNLNDTIFFEHEGFYMVAENMAVTCIVLGCLLHYSILASFMWMLITAVLQFVRYVRVLGVCRPSRFMVKSTLVGWGVPIIPIIVILLIDKENYIPDSYETSFGRGLICYPKGFILIMSVILPICIILAINVILFLIVLYSIYRGPDGKMRSTDIDLIGAQFRLSIFLFFLLGLTWIFGILSFTNNLVWSYLFCLTSTLQGFVLFIYFVVCDPSTRNLWISLMTPSFRISTQRESITSISSS